MTLCKNRLKTGITAVLACAMLLSLAGCAGSPPDLEEVYDRVVQLVEASYELNTVFYGEGLPVYAKDSEYAKENGIYPDHYEGTYELVADYARFRSVSEIQEAAQKVYSEDYLNNVLYPAAFEGYAFTDGKGGSVVGEARYYEDSGKFYQSSTAENLLKGKRIYDYATMEMVRPGNAKMFKVSMRSWLDTAPEKVQDTVLTFTLGTDGVWYLDTFTG